MRFDNPKYQKESKESLNERFADRKPPIWVTISLFLQRNLDPSYDFSKISTPLINKWGFRL